MHRELFGLSEIFLHGRLGGVQAERLITKNNKKKYNNNNTKDNNNQEFRSSRSGAGC